jgi:hypothetical protein
MLWGCSSKGAKGAAHLPTPSLHRASSQSQYRPQVCPGLTRAHHPAQLAGMHAQMAPHTAAHTSKQAAEGDLPPPAPPSTPVHRCCRLLHPCTQVLRTTPTDDPASRPAPHTAAP